MNPAQPEHLDTSSDALPDQASARAEVVAFAAALGRVLETAKLYEAAHPLVAKQADAACVALREACGGSETLSLGVGPRRLYDGEARFTEPAEAMALSEAWHAAELGRVTFARSLDAEALRKAATAWLSPAFTPSAECLRELERETSGGVKAEPLHYERLRTSESAGDARGSHWSWRSLFDDAFDPTAADAEWEQAFASLAGRLRSEVEASAEDALDGLHREVYATLRDTVDATASPARGANDAASTRAARNTVHRLGRLLEAVSPEVRKRMLAATPGLAVSEPVSSCGSERDFAAVLEAIKNLDGQLNEAACESLRMCQKLASLAGTMAEAGETQDDEADASGLVTSLQELLDQHAPANFTPEAYRQRLNEIAGGVGLGGKLSERVRQAFAPDAVRRHAFDLALHMATAGGDEPGPEAWRHLRHRLPSFVEQAQLRPIAQATRAAEARLARGGPDETLAACRALLNDLEASIREDGRLGALLDASADPEDAATVLRHADTSVLHEAVRRLADLPSDADAAALAPPLRNLGGPLNTIAEALIAEAPARRLPLVRRLAPLSFATAARWLGSTLTQKDPAGRAEAFAALVQASPTWPADAAEGLLQHPDENVRSAAVQRLLHQTDRASLAAVGRLLTGKTIGRSAGPALTDRVVRALLQHPANGHAVLRDVLHHANQLRWGKRKPALDPVVAAIRQHADAATAETLIRSVLGAAV
ncbi:MAG: hypothetical protein AAGE65_11580 [Planctomycetota bacterium]